MPNYSLRLRPIYDPNEETGGERISRGIGAAIQQYTDREARRRAEINAIQAKGGRQVPVSDPGVMGRIRGIGGALRRVLSGDAGQPGGPVPLGGTPPFVQPGYGGTPPFMPTIDTGARTTDQEDVFRGLNTGTDMARDGFGASNVTPPVFGAPTPDIDMKGRVRGTNRFPTAPQPGSTATMSTPPAQPGRPQPGAAPMATTAVTPGVGSALMTTPYRYKGEFGEYDIDPMYEQNLAFAGHERTAQADQARTIAGEQRAETTRQAHINEQIEAAVAGGMSRGEARARVLNNVMRYDETFGQQQRPASGMTFDQRVQFQKQVAADREAANAKRDAAAYERAKLIAGNGSPADIRRASLAIQAADLEIKALNDRAAAYERNAAAAQGTVPTDPISRQIATSTPEGAARVRTAESTSTAERAKAGATRDQVTPIVQRAVGRADSMSRAARPDDTRTSPARKPVAQVDAELKAQGLNAAQRREKLKAMGYNVQ